MRPRPSARGPDVAQCDIPDFDCGRYFYRSGSIQRRPAAAILNSPKSIYGYHREIWPSKLTEALGFGVFFKYYEKNSQAVATNKLPTTTAAMSCLNCLRCNSSN